MSEAAPQIRPAAVDQKTKCGVIASVCVLAEFDVRDENGTILAIRTAPNAPTAAI